MQGGRSSGGGGGGGGRLVEAVPFGGDGGGDGTKGGARHRMLCEFAAASPIYAGPGRTADVGGVRCTVLEGNIDRLWLGSVRNALSRAPFSPTWLASAHALAAAARDAGCAEAVDIGSGDGRIAHCAALLGMRAHSIELDGRLAGLQRDDAARTGSGVDVRQADAASLDYGRLGLSRPAFFVGGLAQMGGDALAVAALSYAASSLPAGAALFALPGTLSPKYAPDPLSMAGWGRTVAGTGLRVERTVLLPAAWTLGEPDAVPYLIARTGGSASRQEGDRGAGPARAGGGSSSRQEGDRGA